MDVGAYLSRIGYQGPSEPTLETLRGLHRCHLFSVPFESLSVHCGEPITLALPLLYNKIVQQRRGGFCYENNGLFLWLLRVLGFSAVGLAGRVRNRFTGRFGPPLDHLVLLARLGDQRFLCDVGFGDGFLEPLQLEPGLEQPQEGSIFRLGLVGGSWVLERLGVPSEERRMLYNFTLEERELGDFAAMCHYHQSAPSSIFACKSFCSLPQPGGGRLTYMGWRLIATQGGQRMETALQAHEIPALLQHVFGAQLSSAFVPKDQDIQPPPEEEEEMGPDPPTPPKQGDLLPHPNPTE
ncbi:arylamine N-acetyltransferase 2-like [Emydura macquarii macquarii]|uniref:arylamine N-acetyltransferase 2-like n=1 Tax=Emydura macquarii macquarii TaxID=1129001 RepID=UPI00352B201C